MKTRLFSLIIMLAALVGVHPALGQPVITSFSQNGVLVCSNLQPGSLASVQWAPSPTGPWQSNWSTLSAVMAQANHAIQVSVPMYYRVVGVTGTTNSFTTDGMALIPAYSFTIGDALDGASDAPPTNVYVSGFYMDTNLVTYGLWTSVAAYATANGYNFGAGHGLGKNNAANQPVHTVDWYDCVKWCNARSQQAGLTPVYYFNTNMLPAQVYKTGEDVSPYTNLVIYANWTANGYRLPTEAEWEKAAQAGGQRFPWGNTINESQANYVAIPLALNPAGFAYDVNSYIGYNTNFATGSAPYTSPVGSFAANGFGLYDMAGNLSEWCWDWYAGPPFGVGSPYLGGSDPHGAGNTGIHAARGGAWQYNAKVARCANRFGDFPDDAYYANGFRCVRKQ